MILTAPEESTVFFVCSNLRAVDHREIYALRFDFSPYYLMKDVMAHPEMAWVAWHEGRPAVVFGGAETHPGRWQIFCFGTEAWSKLAIPLTRFIRKKMLPILFDDLDAQRLEADSHADHTQAHRWMELCGAHLEGVKRGYGKDGSDYFTYVILRPA